MTTIHPTNVPDAVIGQHFPLDGPYDDDHTIAAARLVAELVRYLNHATCHPDSASWAGTVDRVIGALSDAEYGQQQTYSQLAERLTDAATDPLAYLAQPVQGRTSPRQAGLAADAELDQATAHFQHLRSLDTVADGRAYLDSQALTKPDLAAICRAAGLHPLAAASKSRLVDQAVNQAIGARRKFNGLHNW